MLNIILSFLLVHTILFLFLKPKSNSLYCGLFGYVGIARKFDKKTFYTLGCINDVRGGDSCGVFIDGEVEYGVDKEKLFAAFYDTSELLEKTKVAKVALGHCRKASVGAVGVTTAQPVVIRNKETGETEFVLIHNGTLLNHKELAKKYLKDTPDTFTDSQIMAYIIYFKGFEVLTEYEGAGAFVMIDYRKNRENPDVYMFKGESLQFHYSKETTEERPLYFSVEDRGIWFSSIAQFLDTTRYGESINGGVKTVKCNFLYHIKAGVIKSRTFMDRTKRHQSGPAVYNYSVYERDFRTNPMIPIRQVNPPANYSSGAASSTFICSTFAIPSYNVPGRLIFIDGFYYISGKKAHGTYELTEYGYIPTTFKAGVKDFWFFDGVLVYNKTCFEIIVALCEKFGYKKVEDYLDGFPETVYCYSPQVYFDTNDKKFIKYEKNLNLQFSGTMGLILDQDDTEYNFTNGILKSKTTYVYCANKKQLPLFEEKAKEFENIDKDDEINRMCILLNWFDNKNKDNK